MGGRVRSIGLWGFMLDCVGIKICYGCSFGFRDKVYSVVGFFRWFCVVLNIVFVCIYIFEVKI